MRELDVAAILRVLADHDVAYVVIGGVGALLHGSPELTVDLDITPAADRANLQRLAAALRDLQAMVRVPGQEEPVAMPLDAEALSRFTTLTLATRHGLLDLAFRPDAPGRRSFTYDELASRAVVITIPPDVPVAALDDIIASKEASGRDKDLRALPTLYTLRDRLGGGGQAGR